MPVKCVECRVTGLPHDEHHKPAELKELRAIVARAKAEEARIREATRIRIAQAVEVNDEIFNGPCTD